MTVIDVKQRHNVWKALEAPSAEPVLLEKVLAEDRSSRLNTSSQDRHRIHSAVEPWAPAPG